MKKISLILISSLFAVSSFAQEAPANSERGQGRGGRQMMQQGQGRQAMQGGKMGMRNGELKEKIQEKKAAKGETNDNDAYKKGFKDGLLFGSRNKQLLGARNYELKGEGQAKVGIRGQGQGRQAMQGGMGQGQGRQAMQGGRGMGRGMQNQAPAAE